MHVFTSITANYLPKAAVLAHSVKAFHPEAVFHLVLSDVVPPNCPRTALAAFDSIIRIEDLPIENLSRWVFRHRLVELCTAVKGPAFQHIADRYGADRIYYFDPDITLFHRLDDLEARLDRSSVLLTPHQTEPQPADAEQAIIDNEICSLQHGVYNLGFLAVRMTVEGRRFIDWWADRLRRFCYANIPVGLFTDQRWIDLAPAFFDDIRIVREPQYNVATWNMTHRHAAGRIPDGVTINGQPLVFYHFSGFDSGAQEVMLERYGSHSPVFFALRDWYIQRCEEMGQGLLGKLPCIHGSYRNGERVPDTHRLLYRGRPDLMVRFPDPYETFPESSSYYHWCQSHGSELAAGVTLRPARFAGLKRIVRKHAPEPALHMARRIRSLLQRS
jgi:hypothetical protein